MHAYRRAPMFMQQKQCNNFISYTVTLYRCFATILRTYGAFFECRVSCFSRFVPHSQLVFAFSHAHASCEHTYLHKNINAYFYHLHAYFSVTLYIFVHLRCTLFIKKYVYACLHIIYPVILPLAVHFALFSFVPFHIAIRSFSVLSTQYNFYFFLLFPFCCCA